MNWKWRGEDEEDNNLCIGNRAYIRLWEIFTSQKRILNTEIDKRSIISEKRY